MNAFLRSTSIRQRLLGSLLALCVMILGMGGWAAMSFRGLQQQAAELLDSQAQGLRATGDLLASLERVHSLAQAVLLNGNNPVEAGEILGQWQKASASTLAQLKSAGEGASHPALSDALAGFTAYSTAVGEVLPKVAAATLDGAAGFAYVGQAQADFDKSREGVRLWSDAVLADIVARHEADRTAEALQSNLRLATVIVALGLFCALMLAIVRSISGPLEQARHSAQRIAQGDLSVDIHSQGRDEVAQFMTTLAEMQASLRRIVGQVRNSADSIRVASDEVASGNLDLSQRTEQAASNLQ
ncbi:HAMP domain-containing protein, partial [Ideonella sp.]|uniref:HAMP domain-containing protein n=1 Tax=Ideonella sp. TaxID=1929293 RepID=UPI003BB54B93